MTLKDNLDGLQIRAKERTVKTQSIEYDLETLVKKIHKGTIKLDPDYQRRHRWSNETSSKLIESLILNIPIPIVYLSYDIDVDENIEGARYTVIDGQQRLTAILNFFNNRYTLSGLDILGDLVGCYYKDLPPFLLRRLEERTIKCLRIDSTVDPQVKYDIFERLNSGSIKLESHELRNAVYRGPFNKKCKELSENANYRKLIQVNISDLESIAKVKKMEDVELVLRFFALINDNYKNFKKPKGFNFKDFLSVSLKNFNTLEEAQINDLGYKFERLMQIIIESFGSLAFAKYTLQGDNLEKQSNFNAAVYDALTVSIYSEVSLDRPNITETQIENFKSLFKNPDFYNSVNGAIADPIKIQRRIDQARSVFKK